jgi:hypothetical protein
MRRSISERKFLSPKVAGIGADIDMKDVKDTDFLTNYENLKKDYTKNQKYLDAHKTAYEALVKLNEKRKVKLKFIICYFCGSWNEHLTSNCPKKFCNICKNSGHFANKCPCRIFCQICGSTSHLTKFCDDAKAIELRILKYVKCAICGKYGHYAIECYNPNPNFRNYKFNRYRGSYNYYNFRSRGKYRGYRNRWNFNNRYNKYY